MSRERWFLSLLIAYHLVAVTLAALPTRDALDRFNETRLVHRTFLPTVLDALAGFAHDGEMRLLSGSVPLRLMTRPYIQAGLRQRWNMFSNPGTDDRYMRADYYYEGAGPGSDVMVVRELVFPADDETRVRFVHRFRDKAIFNAVETYFLRRDRVEGKESSAADAREALAPVARHFTRQFARSRLPEGSRMIRTELWYGSAPIPPPGREVAEQDFLMRMTALDRYRDSALPPQRGALAPPAIGFTQRESDITWVLLEVDEGR